MLIIAAIMTLGPAGAATGLQVPRHLIGSLLRSEDPSCGGYFRLEEGDRVSFVVALLRPLPDTAPWPTVIPRDNFSIETDEAASVPLVFRIDGPMGVRYVIRASKWVWDHAPCIIARV